MIQFAFFINGNHIESAKAVRVSGNPGQVCTYDVYYKDKVFKVKHFYDDGAWKLMEIVAKEVIRRNRCDDDPEQNKD